MLFHRAIDLICLGSVASEGVGFLLPFAAFSRFPNFAAMARLANEDVWGSIYLAAGLLWLTGLLLRLNRTTTSAMLLCFAVRLMQTLMIGEASGWEAPGIYGYAWWAAGCGWCYIRSIWRRASDASVY